MLSIEAAPGPIPADPARTVALPHLSGDHVIPWLGVIRPHSAGEGGGFDAHAPAPHGWIGTFPSRAEALARLEETAGWHPPQAKGAILRHRYADADPDDLVPATPFDELAEQYAENVHGQGGTDAEQAAHMWRLRRDARYLLAEVFDGAYMLSSHDSIADATKHADDPGTYAWSVDALYDLVTGRTYEGVKTTAFHRTDQRHPEAGQPFHAEGVPAELLRGRLVGWCGHGVPGSEYRAGLRVCEHGCQAADYGREPTTDADVTD